MIMIPPRFFDCRCPKGMASPLPIFFSIIIFSAFTGHFTCAKAQEVGTLSVITTPVSGAIYVDKVLKAKAFWSGDLDAGFHSVSFGNVDGYTAPSPRTVTVIANQTYYVIGAYRKLLPRD